MKGAYRKLTAPDEDNRLRNGFHVAIVILHFISSVLATVLVFKCDVSRATQHATIPYALPPPPDIPEYMAYRGGYPRAEDGDYTGNTWNPYTLIMGFEWITAGFAFCNLKSIWNGAQNLSWVWLGIGSVILVAWNFLNIHSLSPAMSLVLFGSFLAAGLICAYFDEVHGKVLKKGVTKVQHHETPSPQKVEEPKAATKIGVLIKANMDGREWQIPKAVKGLKLGPEATIDTNTLVGTDDFHDAKIIAFRYSEYCLTAPLLFLAVVCLLTVDAPAWLFLSGYFLILACNLLGVVLHYNIFIKLHIDNGKGWIPWFNDIAIAGSWRNKGVFIRYLLEATWICLLVPMTGLIYLINDYLFSPNLPDIAKIMIWNLIIGYSMFGLIPTLVYVSGKGLHHLDWLLDILNVAAKFPLPILILVAFQTRPTMFKPCVS